MVFPSVAVLRFQIFQKLPLLLVALDVSLNKYALHWAAQIGCPTSLVPYLLASHALRNHPFWMIRISHSGSKLETDYDFFCDYFQILGVVIPQYSVLIWFNLSQCTKTTPTNRKSFGLNFYLF